MQKFAVAILFLLLFIGCKKKAQQEAAREPLKFYFRATINGQPFNWEIRETKIFDGSKVRPFRGYAQVGNDCTKWCMDAICGSEFFLDTPANGLVKNKVRVYYTYGTKKDNITEDKLLPFFQTGIAAFGSSRITADEPPRDGFIISYSDSIGGWRTSAVNWGSQAGNSFEITGINDAPAGAYFKKTWKAKFSCKLFDRTIGYIELKDGEIFGPLFEK